MWKSTFFLLIISAQMIMGQNQKEFKIIGKSNYYDKKELLIAAVGLDKDYLEIGIDSSFDKVDFPMKYVKVRNNAFEIKGKVDYPIPMQITEEKMIDGSINFNISHVFFVQAGVTHVKINNLQSPVIELLDITAANNEFLKIRALYKHLEINNQSSMFFPNVTDIHEKHKILNKYITEHPGSYIALWITILDYTSNGYISEIFNNTTLFSDEIKSSRPYKTLIQKLNIEKTLVVGSQISRNILPNKYKDFHKNKITLIEFWATWCKPCLALIPDLKKIYTDYHSKGFEIYGISSDEASKKAIYEKTLRKYEMKWENMMEPEVLNNWNINSLPSNFLIDSEGTIIAIDISPGKLEKLLKEKLIN
ncbi:TlpA family protein disulfide reductase [Emticicia sp. 21SJ11W-3]|uniref:TlpA family protein disulfide reductase n=1 Tax=Emticicia sp. 21SJ11W-3 TaxID=2916755 RepID=UPI0020A0B615|nr:TlpA family protein disulfide reductase [Emticicia sp. 21SJ11W-3]UTA66645.1 TlpA family protein disulfide reductase [Emticicia sp. 21SJ11W-3]